MRNYFYSDELDLDGNPVERTRAEYPYSYDPYVTYRSGKKEEIKNTVYSDRLFQWDYKKFDNLCQKHFGDKGQGFGGRNPISIESFLQDYFDIEDLKLIAIQEGANVSTGYPYWIFHTT